MYIIYISLYPYNFLYPYDILHPIRSNPIKSTPITSPVYLRGLRAGPRTQIPLPPQPRPSMAQNVIMT